MPIYKDLNGNLHELPSDEFSHLLPAGCVKITDAEAAAFQHAPAETQEQALERAFVDIRVQRAPILNALAGVQSDALTAMTLAESEADEAAAKSLLVSVKNARQALKDIPQTPGLSTAATYDEMKDVVMVRYREIATTAPVAVRKAFAEVVPK